MLCSSYVNNYSWNWSSQPYCEVGQTSIVKCLIRWWRDFYQQEMPLSCFVLLLLLISESHWYPVYLVILFWDHFRSFCLPERNCHKITFLYSFSSQCLAALIAPWDSLWCVLSLPWEGRRVALFFWWNQFMLFTHAADLDEGTVCHPKCHHPSRCTKMSA